MAAKMFSLASCGALLYLSGPYPKLMCFIVMLFYDMTITFSDEVEKIWKRRFTGATFLWLVVSTLSLFNKTVSGYQ